MDLAALIAKNKTPFKISPMPQYEEPVYRNNRDAGSSLKHQLHSESETCQASQRQRQRKKYDNEDQPEDSSDFGADADANVQRENKEFEVMQETSANPESHSGHKHVVLNDVNGEVDYHIPENEIVRSQPLQTNSTQDAIDRTAALSLGNGNGSGNPDGAMTNIPQSRHEKVETWRKFAMHDAPYNSGIKVALNLALDHLSYSDIEWGRWENRARNLLGQMNEQYFQTLVEEARAIRAQYKSFLVSQLANIQD